MTKEEIEDIIWGLYDAKRDIDGNDISAIRSREDIDKAIKAIETLQAEPVVRCIDCIFWYDCEYTFKSENGFCCCGERE